MLLFLISGILFQFIDVSGQGTPYNFNEDEIKLILHEHNRYRASEPAANMQELVWNENLVDVAREWATKCIGDHRPNRSFKAGFAAVGENLWWTSSSILWKNLRRVIWDFYREKYIYDFNTGYCPPGQLCGHYTQHQINLNASTESRYPKSEDIDYLVWASSCSIGCAAAFCPYFYNGRGIRSGVMVACNYGPAGNYAGQKPYIYGRNCQMCPDACRNGLCQSKCTGYAIPQIYSMTNVDNRITTSKLQSQYGETASHSTTKFSTTAATTTTARPPTASMAEKRPQGFNAPWKNKDCVNRHPDCMTFMKLKFCFVQRPYMLRYCRLACDISCHSKK